MDYSNPAQTTSSASSRTAGGCPSPYHPLPPDCCRPGRLAAPHSAAPRWYSDCRSTGGGGYDYDGCLVRSAPVPGSWSASRLVCPVGNGPESLRRAWLAGRRARGWRARRCDGGRGGGTMIGPAMERSSRRRRPCLSHAYNEGEGGGWLGCRRKYLDRFQCWTRGRFRPWRLWFGLVGGYSVYVVVVKGARTEEVWVCKGFDPGDANDYGRRCAARVRNEVLDVLFSLHISRRKTHTCKPCSKSPRPQSYYVEAYATFARGR